MLDFIEVDGRLAANSKAVPFRIYLIDDYAWTYLSVSGSFGTTKPFAFNSLEAAKESAEAMEIDAMRESK